MPTITVIETGTVPEGQRARHGTYPQMFARAFGAGRPDLAFETVVAAQETYPAVETLEAVMITGSAAGVYEDHAWIAPLSDFVRRVHAAGVPMVGICFGHQLVAQALGGVVAPSDRGWGIGRHVYRPAAGNGVLDGSEVALACSHQDQVLVPPEGAEVILASDFTPYAGLLYDNGTTLTLQPHPEFTVDYAMFCATSRSGHAPDAVVTAAVDSLQRPLDSAAVNGAITRFMTERVGKPTPAREAR